jgi:hypothetical protein
MSTKFNTKTKKKNPFLLFMGHKKLQFGPKIL